MKYLSIFACIALLIASIVFMPFDTGNEVTVGEGNGTNEKLNDPEDMQALLKYISDHNESDVDSGHKDLARLSYDESQETYDGEENKNQNKSRSKNKTQDYESVTIHEQAYITSSYHLSTHNENLGYIYSDSNSIFCRQLSVYMTESASYYHSVGQISSTSEYDAPGEDDDEHSYSYLSFDVEIFFNGDTSEILMKINKWSMVSELKTIIISDEILGRWVSFDNTVFDYMNMIDGANRDSLGEIEKIINIAIDKDMFDKNKGKYSLSKKEFKEILGADDLENGEFVVDMSNSECPVVSMKVSGSSKNKPNSNYAYNATSHTNVQYTFENINNTIVRMDKNADILEIDEDEVDSYIFVED